MEIYIAVVLMVLSFSIWAAMKIIKFADPKRKVKDEDVLFTRKRQLPAWMYTFWFNAYNALVRIPVLRFYLERLKAQYDFSSPGNERASKESAAKIAVMIWGAGVFCILFAIWMQAGLYFLLCLATAVFIFSAQFINSNSEKKELQLLQEFRKFLNDVQQLYISHGMVDEAIFDTMENTRSIMRVQAEMIYDTLTADDRDEALFKYNSSVHNKFLQQFMAICSTTMQYGDRRNEEGMSVFMLNLIALGVDVEEYILDRKLNKYKFSSLVGISVVPIFALEPLARWAIAQDATFTTFYRGTGGILAEAALFVVMLFCYTRVVQLRDAALKDNSDHFVLRTVENLPAVKQVLDAYEEKNYGKMHLRASFLKEVGSALTARQLVLQKFAYAAVAFVAGICVCISIVVTIRNSSITDYRTVGGITNAASEEDSIAMMMLAKRYVDKMKDTDWLAIYKEQFGHKAYRYNSEVKAFLEEQALDGLTNNTEDFSIEDVVWMAYQYNDVFYQSTQLDTKLLGREGDGTFDKDTADGARILLEAERIQKIARGPDGLSEGTLKEDVAEKVADRVASYRGAYFKWYYLVVCYLLAVASYFLPEFMLKSKKESMQVGMEDEVIQFMAVISILRGIKRMSIETLMSWMEVFSDIFEPSIEKCINNYPNGQIDALRQLKEDEKFVQFGYLVDGLIICDRIGINNAFTNVDSDRKIFQEKRKQENMIRRDNAAASAKLIAYVPMNAVIIGYLVLPFLWKAFTNLAAYMSQMSSI